MSFDKKAWTIAWRSKNRDRCCAYAAKYRRKNPDKVKKYYTDWVALNLETKRKRNREHMRRWNKANPELAAQRKRDQYQRDPERAKYMWRRATERRKLDPSKKILSDLRKSIHGRLRKGLNTKSAKTVELLGCSIPSFRIYLESKFESGMTWDNYGRYGWHIDHIMPCAIFDLSKPEHQKRCFHFSNLQPMWAFENLSKGSQVTTNQFNLL